MDIRTLRDSNNGTVLIRNTFYKDASRIHIYKNVCTICSGIKATSPSSRSCVISRI